jgi:hypothetical protein
MKHLDKVTGGYASKIVKPVLIVDDTHDDDIVKVEKAVELCPLPGRGGNPQKYHGKVVQFDGYAASVTMTLNDVIRAITLAIPGAQVIPDAPTGLKMAVIGVYDILSLPLIPDLIMVCVGGKLPETSLPVNIPVLPQNLPDFGHYRFTVAVTDLPPLLGRVVPVSIRDFVENGETGFFLLDSKLLDQKPPPLENLIATVDLGGVFIHSHPNIYSPPIPGPLMLPWEGPPLPKYVTCPLKLNMENTTDATVTVSNINFKVYILGQYAGDGIIQGPYTISAHQTLSINEDFRAEFSTAGEIVMQFLKNFSFKSTPAENLDITLVGSASVTSGAQTKVISFG